MTASQELDGVELLSEQLERSSLGTPGARQLRARVSTPLVKQIADRLSPQPRTPPTHTIRVLVADDHVLFRRGLEMVLQSERGIVVIGEAGDGITALRRAAELRPDVILLDVRMPKQSGIEACLAIKQAVPSSRILMLTMSDDESDLVDAIRAGASGYLLKDIPGEEIAAGIRAVHAGTPLISASVASRLLAEFALISREKAPDSHAPQLTGREVEVLRLVARGLGTRDIGQRLFISEHSVKSHVRNILEKVQLHTRLRVADRAGDEGPSARTSPFPDDPRDPALGLGR
jgi:two-component system NarL family response regulator